MDLYKFGRCFKDRRDEEGKGPAYKNCSALFKDVEIEIDGEVLPDGKPQHNMYDLTPEALLKIDRLVSQK